MFIKNITSAIDNALNSTIPFENIAISMHGSVDSVNGISIFSPHNNWEEEVNLKEIIESKFTIQTIVDNDCNVLALTHKWKISEFKNKVSSFMLVNLDYGIGASIILNNNIYRGKNFDAGQIGHIPVKPNGRKCKCGNYGCLETIMSEQNILRIIKKEIQQQKLRFECRNIKEVINIVNDNQTMQMIIKENILYLAQIIINILCLLDLKEIIFTGSITKLDPLLIETLEEYIYKRFKVLKGFVKNNSKLCEFKVQNTYSNNLGNPALLWLEYYFNNNVNVVDN